MQTLYKVLNRDMTSPFQSFQYRKRKWYHCDDFDTNPNHDCSNGFYATDIDGFPYSFNIHRAVYECRVKGDGVEFNQFKRRYPNIIIDREVPHDEVRRLAAGWNNRVGYKLSEVLFPVNPLLLDVREVNDEHISLLGNWASVGASVGDSVGASVGDSVGASVWDSVRDSVWASVGASVGGSVRGSVWDSVGAYCGSLFPNITNWQCINHAFGEYPFQPCVDLWRQGFVPSCGDGKIWRLHAGRDAAIVWEGKI